jgi:mRNA-degrading endonuclease RelE of RelBE toxin-antitoxin system
LEKLPPDAYATAREGIQELERELFPRRSQKLGGKPGYRWKKRDVRILYIVSGDHLLVTVVRIAARKEAYGRRAQRRF